MEDTVMPEKTREKSIPTHTKLGSIEFPRSSESELIIPCNPSGYGFILQTDKDGESIGLSASDINGPLRRINKLIDSHLVEKKVAESKDYNASYLSIIKTLGLISFFFMYSLYLLIIYDVQGMSDGIAFILFGLVIILLIVCAVFMFKALGTKRDYVDIEDRISKTIDRAVEKENKDMLHSHGITIHKGEKFAWLTFRKKHKLK